MFQNRKTKIERMESANVQAANFAYKAAMKRVKAELLKKERFLFYAIILLRLSELTKHLVFSDRTVFSDLRIYSVIGFSSSVKGQKHLPDCQVFIALTE